MNNELKPCPFCGEEATVWLCGEGYLVECNNEICGCVYGSNITLTRDQAVKLWNKRAKEKK